MKNDLKEISIGEIISITVGLIAGTALAIYVDWIELVPGLFILLPGFLEMRGNISGSLSARLSSALHLGSLKPRIKNTKILRENLIATITLVILVSLLLGIIAYFAGLWFFHINNMKIIYVSIIAALVSNVFMIPLTVYFCFWLYRHGHDPDNIMGPYITSIGDFVSIVSLLVAILVVV